MKHAVNFLNVQNDWHNALPLGNSVFGAMAFYKDQNLTFAMNHYEIYYRLHSRYSRTVMEEREKSGFSFAGRKPFEEYVRLADEKRLDWQNGPVNHYFESLFGFCQGYGKANEGVSHPAAGEWSLQFEEGKEASLNTHLQLQIEDARLLFHYQKGTDKVLVTSFAGANESVLAAALTQSRPGLLTGLRLSYPPCRGSMETSLRFLKGSEDWFGYEVSFYPPGEDKARHKPFRFQVAVRISGAKGEAVEEGGAIFFRIREAQKELHIFTEIFCENEEQVDGEEDFFTEANRRVLEKRSYKPLEEEHQKRWKGFWKSAVRLPDRFLETLWYLNLYVLECSSGKNGRFYQQASGLNGLWDIKRPTIWGSLWYWDVNIEASYWPVYTANHTELSQVFCDGFLSYEDEACQFAKDIYGAEGWAMDFPHTLYNCIQPWCAQFLWWQYEYTGDKIFLKERAYPAFCKMLTFIQTVFRYDEKRGEYYIYPDVSPEQGPLTRNSTITLAVVKYLLQITIQAGEVLKEPEERLKSYRDMLAHYPPYPRSPDGKRLKDSEDAPPDLWLRHPSVLMPIYPIGELNADTKADRDLGCETLRYAEDHTEVGVFGFGWLSCAASRLGLGGDALRIFYEKGPDYSLRSNGLGYEETDRFINHCCITQRPFYYPAMMEFTGETVASVNEMLLQSFDGVIRVFPAVPDGKRDEAHEKGYYRHEAEDRFPREPAWESARFDRLLAKGGFEVSACWENGIKWVLINSLRGGAACLRGLPNAFAVFFEESGKWACHPFQRAENGDFWLDTEAGKRYLLCKALSDCPGDMGGVQPEGEYPKGALTREAHTHRRIFIGEDRDTCYYKALDGFLFEYRVGDHPRSHMTPYKFDFGNPALRKDYRTASHRQVILGQPQMNMSGDYIQIGPDRVFTDRVGFGFREAFGLVFKDRGAPDDLRRDFVCGGRETEFLVELPKGRYDLLIISGDPREPTVTHLETEGLTRRGRLCEAGETRCVTLPVVHEEDGILTLKISTDLGMEWTVSALLINRWASLL